jgi:PhoH-like ATPase
MGGEVSRDVVVIEDFEGWNDWYQHGEIALKDIGDPDVHPNSGIILKGSGCKEHGIVRGQKVVRIKPYSPCKISPKNSEQTLALEMLRDNPLAIISGVAGSGKTLLACAHALHRLHSKDNISKIVIAKSITPVGRDIGYLKGSMEEKVMPWLGSFRDNFLNCGYSTQDIERMVDEERLEITPITYIQGRSISNAIIIMDEVQNLDLNTVKQIITRAAEGTQIILLGDQSQVFEYRNKDYTLDVLLEKAKPSPIVASIHLEKSVRSPIASWAVQNL